jgi:hypothetical protein
MTDTSEQIKKIQLDIWLQKSPMERLRQSIIDNEALFNFWKNTSQQIKEKQHLHQENNKT